MINEDLIKSISLEYSFLKLSYSDIKHLVEEIKDEEKIREELNTIARDKITNDKNTKDENLQKINKKHK